MQLKIQRSQRKFCSFLENPMKKILQVFAAGLLVALFVATAAEAAGSEPNLTAVPATAPAIVTFLAGKVCTGPQWASGGYRADITAEFDMGPDGLHVDGHSEYIYGRRSIPTEITVEGETILLKASNSTVWTLKRTGPSSIGGATENQKNRSYGNISLTCK